MTYSIVARDAATGALGVAVQSHWFSVGPLVPWAEAGVGAVATQANVDVSYGPRALALLRDGATAQDAIAELIAGDDGAAHRQAAIVDARGNVAAHTGPECMAFAGHSAAADYSCQANLMADAGVWPAMAAAFEAAPGSLTRRLLAALDAAERAGGDVRGRQSAAIVVVPAAGEPWDRIVDLRVEDHPEPLDELRRLVTLHDAYVLAGEGDWLVSEGDHARAAERYLQAHELAPDNTELLFWAGLALAGRGDGDRGLALVRQAIDRHAGWRELLDRLTPQIAPAAAEVRALLD